MSPERQAGWRRAAAWLGALVLGAVLLVAAYGKALDPRAFGEQIAHEGLDVLLPAAAVAWIVIVAEVGLGTALVLGLRTRPVLAATGGLVVVFLFLTGRAYWRWLSGVEISGPDCGCFGNLVSRTPAEAFWQDLALLVPGYCASWLAVVSGGALRHSIRTWIVAVLAVAAGVFTLMAPGLPLDDLATRLAPGVEVSELCAGPASRDEGESACLDLVVPELLTGRHSVVIADLADSELAAAVPALNAAAAGDGTRLWVVSDAAQEVQQTFFWEHGPMFEMREVPTPLLRPLYRSLPRTFIVVDGRVESTSRGLPAELEAVPEYHVGPGGRGHGGEE